MSSSPQIQTEYERALRAAVLKHGALTDPESHAFGWVADDWEHKRVCVLTSGQVPDESEWTEFGGSFTDHHPTKHGIDLTGVSCACGQIENRTVRWQAGPAEMIQAVFEEAFGARSAT